jgi:hypothetical protein
MPQKDGRGRRRRKKRGGVDGRRGVPGAFHNPKNYFFR